MSSVKCILCLCYSFLDWKFVSQWSSSTVSGGKNAAVQSLKLLWFFSKISFIQSFERVPVERLFTYTNKLSEYTNLIITQTVWLSLAAALFAPLQISISIMTLHILILLTCECGARHSTLSNMCTELKHTHAQKEVREGGGKQTSSDKFVAHLVQTVWFPLDLREW